MVIRILLVVAAFAGCDRWREPEPIWQLEASLRDSRDLAPSLRAVPSVKGETIAIVANSHVGNRLLDGANIVRISAAGELVAVRALPELGDVEAVVVGVDLKGRAVAVWGRVDSTHYVYAFDENLEPRWSTATGGVFSTMCCNLAKGMFSVGPEGEVAFTTTPGAGTATLHYFGNDGLERWTVDFNGLHHIVVNETGDVLVYRRGVSPTAVRARVAASDGTVQDEISYPIPWIAARDGTSMGLPSPITFYEPDGSVRWSTSDVSVEICPFGGCRELGGPGARVMFAGDDVLIVTHQLELTRLDGASGDRTGGTLHCDAFGFEAADETGYLAIGRNCDGNRVLAKFELPD